MLLPPGQREAGRLPAAPLVLLLPGPFGRLLLAGGVLPDWDPFAAGVLLDACRWVLAGPAPHASLPPAVLRLPVAPNPGLLTPPADLCPVIPAAPPEDDQRLASPAKLAALWAKPFPAASTTSEASAMSVTLAASLLAVAAAAAAAVATAAMAFAMLLLSLPLLADAAKVGASPAVSPAAVPGDGKLPLAGLLVPLVPPLSGCDCGRRWGDWRVTPAVPQSPAPEATG